MKTFILLALAAVISIPSFAQSISVSGEGKTGIVWERTENRQGTEETITTVYMHNRDDAGSGHGRFRINLDYTNAAGNLGFRARLNWENFFETTDHLPFGPQWTYAFGWGSFFNDQLVLSLGKLGASPWSTGGPEMWRELEITNFGGLRVEWKPAFVPGELNIGFVLNWLDDITDDVTISREPTLVDLLLESVIGVSYKNDWFMARAAYRLDSEMDNQFARDGYYDAEGPKIVYRVEEYALQRLVPNLSAWALGYIYGFGTPVPAITFSTENWLFVEYAPPAFTALIRFGYEDTGIRSTYFIRPSFAYNLFDGLLVPSVIFSYANADYKEDPDMWYSYIDIEPKIQVNFAPGAYAAISYYWRSQVAYPPPNSTFTRHLINLRAGITF
ncbi:MAG: hypothetical protein FWG89_08150 [Treponema sp.]|nr:hypothetical protein [Treponema sp.]